MKKCKRLGLLLIIFMLCVTAGKMPVRAAYTSEDGQWTYVTLKDGRIHLQAYNGDDNIEELTIPGVVDGKTVKSVGAVCEYMVNLKSVTIHGNVQKLGDSTFCGCSKLKSVVISDGVEEIGSCVFLDCTQLQSVVIPDSITVLGSEVFSNCRSLKRITLSANLKEIGHGCFWGTSIESITLPDTLEKIGQCAFYKCKSLTSVKIPAKVKSLGGSTFLGCTSLQSAIVPPSVTGSGTVEGSVNDENDHNNPQIFPASTVIYGHAGSFIAQQAAEYGNPFVDGIYKATVKTEPTCTTYGVTEMSCGVCGHRYTVNPPPLGHHMVDVPAQPATFDAPGMTAGTQCDRCGQAGEGMQAVSRIGQMKLSKTEYTYNGKTRKPTVKVTDVDGAVISDRNYTVIYPSGRKKVGQYKITVIFREAYAGTVTKTFTVKPKKTSVKSLQAGKKKLTVKWSKQTTQVTGYQVQAATDKKFTKNVKTVTVKKNKQITTTIKKLKSKKKYYVRVRTYKTVKIGGKQKKIYSVWSKVRSIMVK